MFEEAFECEPSSFLLIHIIKLMRQHFLGFLHFTYDEKQSSTENLN